MTGDVAAELRRTQQALARSEAIRRSALFVLDRADPQDDPGHIAVLLGQLRTVLGTSPDGPRTGDQILAFWYAADADRALAEISRQAPGAPG